MPHRASIVNVSRASGEPEQYWSLEEENVSEKTPPTFLWHTMTDDVVPVENNLLFVRLLHRYGVACGRTICSNPAATRHVGGNARGTDAASRAVRLRRPLPDLATARFRPAGRRCRINCLRRPHLFLAREKDGEKKSAFLNCGEPGSQASFTHSAEFHGRSWYARRLIRHIACE